MDMVTRVGGQVGDSNEELHRRDPCLLSSIVCLCHMLKCPFPHEASNVLVSTPVPWGMFHL